MKASDIPFGVSLIFVALFLIPIGYLSYGIGFFPPQNDNVNVLAQLAGLAQNSLTFGFLSGLLATSMAFTYVWLIVRTNVPGKKVFELLPLLALALPHLLKVFGWILLLSPQIGLINIALKDAFGIGPVFDVFNLPGMIFVQGLDGMALGMIIMIPAVKSMDHSLEEASRISGNSLGKTFLTVTIPTLLPVFLSAYLLISIQSMNLLEAPFILGQGHFSTFATTLYYWVAERAQPDYAVASQFAIANIVITLVLFSVYIYVTRKAFKFVVITGREAPPIVHYLKPRAKWLCFSFLLFALLLVYVLPLSILGVESFLDRGTLAYFPHWGWGNYLGVLDLESFRSSFMNSVWIGVGVALLVTVLAVFMAYAALKGVRRASRIIELMSNIPMAFPGLVYGFALFITFLIAPGISALYGTIYPLIFAVTFIYTPTAFRIISGNLIQISNDLEAAARVTGAGWGRAFTRVTLTLLRRGIFGSLYRAFLDGLRELGPVILLATPGSTVLVALLFTMYASGAGTLGILSAGSVVIALAASAFIIIFKLIEKLGFGST